VAKRNGDYMRTRPIAASCERVFDAIATLDGVRGWWTALVSGSADENGVIELGFEGLDEKITMRVDESEAPKLVRWTCLQHSSLPEWSETKIEFALTARGEHCELAIRHRGLTPALECYDHCEAGWDYFANSIAQLVETGRGTPYRADKSRRS
jgi:uncharacterized protein YndB with AHSA1/START domain